MMLENIFSLKIVWYLFSCVFVYHVLFLIQKRCLKFTLRHKLFFFPVLPLIGTTYLLLFPIIFSGRANVLRILQWTKKYIGYPLNFWLGSSYNYITNDPSEINIILHHPKCYNKGEIYKKGSLGFNNGLTFVDYDEWRLRRKFFMNSFKPSVLKSFVSIVYEQSFQLIEDILTRGEEDDLLKICYEYAFLSFYSTNAGLEKEHCYPELKKYGSLIAQIQDVMVLEIMNPVLPFGIWKRFFPSGKQMAQTTAKMKAMVKDLLEQKRKQICRTQGSNNSVNGMVLFDLIVNVLEKIKPEEEIIHEVAFFAAAATETTGITLTFCFTLLGMHPEIQETLYKEVMDIVGLNDILNDDLPNLKYTEAVISETLRLFPPLNIMTRLIGEDVNLGNKIVPKNTNFLIDVFHLHRDKKYWPNPLKFDPSRFLPENAEKLTPNSFIPFSAGTRDCIGKYQTMKSMKTTVANVIRRLRIVSKYKSVDEIGLKSTILISPEKPIDCHFFLRLVE